MIITMLIILLALAILFIFISSRKISSLKKEQRISREKMKIICHDFKTSLATLHLVVDGLRHYAQLKQEASKGDNLTPLIDILHDIGLSTSQSIAHLLQQTKRMSKEGDSL